VDASKVQCVHKSEKGETMQMENLHSKKPKEAQTHVEVEKEKTCNPVALLAVQMWEHMNDYSAFCDKKTGKIETNPILDFEHLPPE
jgi:hypothetical protein